nr:MAG TPA: hypothetical protein [Caudoviricetes sp.]
MAVFVPNRKDLSKFKRIYKLTLNKHGDCIYFALEKFPIIYINSHYIYYRRNGDSDLTKEQLCIGEKYGIYYTLSSLYDFEVNNCIANYYPKNRFFVEDKVSEKAMKLTISIYNLKIKSYYEEKKKKKKELIENKEKEELTKDTKELIRLYTKITGNTNVKIEEIMNFVLTSKNKYDII